MRARDFRNIFILLASLLVSQGLWGAEGVVTAPMIGHWEGDARIIVSWCPRTNLPVAIDIHPDGSVTGKVGEATLKKARFNRNRGWLGRKLNLKTDYIITGDLSGPIFAREGITRSGVKMPLTFTGTNFTGAVGTTGTKFAGPEQMIFSTVSLRKQ